MRTKTNRKFLGIVLCFIFMVILFAFQTCIRDRSPVDQLDSLGISSDDLLPSWSPDGARIAFTSGRDGNEEVYVMDADGSNQTRLTDNPASDGYPSWSPDGSRITFHSNRDGDYEIYIMNADGSNPTRLTDNTIADGAPSWSPDGTRIVFHSNRDGNMEIYTMNTDGLNPIRMTDNTANDMTASWSPDSDRIVFFSGRDGNAEIYKMNADGSDQTRLTDERSYDNSPSWSPDGQKIAFVSGRDFVNEIYVMNADGSNPVNMTNNSPANEAFGSAPLPRSELNLDEIPYKIVFESFRETEDQENWEICLIDADGSNLINLTNTPEIDELYPHASPDGRRICFIAVEGEEPESKSRNAYYMNIDGTDKIKIAENAFRPCWSADGRFIAYLPGEYPRYNPDKRANKGLEIYDLETGETKQHPNDKINHIAQLCWSPDGKWFVTGPHNKAFKADDKTMMSLSAPGCTPDISPDGKRLAWNGTNSTLNTGTLDFDSPQSSVTAHRIVVACKRDYWVFHADWSPDEKYLTFTYGFDDESDQENRPKPWTNICICDLKTGKWAQITTDGKYNAQPDWVPVEVK